MLRSFCVDLQLNWSECNLTPKQLYCRPDVPIYAALGAHNLTANDAVQQILIGAVTIVSMRTIHIINNYSRDLRIAYYISYSIFLIRVTEKATQLLELRVFWFSSYVDDCL